MTELAAEDASLEREFQDIGDKEEIEEELAKLKAERDAKRRENGA